MRQSARQRSQDVTKASAKRDGSGTSTPDRFAFMVRFDAHRNPGLVAALAGVPRGSRNQTILDLLEKAIAEATPNERRHHARAPDRWALDATSTPMRSPLTPPVGHAAHERGDNTVRTGDFLDQFE
jgi:hypothetical protein